KPDAGGEAEAEGEKAHRRVRGGAERGDGPVDGHRRQAAGAAAAAERRRRLGRLRSGEIDAGDDDAALDGLELELAVGVVGELEQGAALELAAPALALGEGRL